MEKKDMIIAEYAAYTLTDMEAEETAQKAKANNANLSPAIRRDALDRLEVIALVNGVFEQVLHTGALNLNTRFDAAFYIATGKTLESIKSPSMLSNATQGFIKSTDHIADVTIDAVRGGLNKFAVWLNRKTTK